MGLTHLEENWIQFNKPSVNSANNFILLRFSVFTHSDMFFAKTPVCKACFIIVRPSSLGTALTPAVMSSSHLLTLRAASLSRLRSPHNLHTNNTKAWCFSRTGGQHRAIPAQFTTQMNCQREVQGTMEKWPLELLIPPAQCLGLRPTSSNASFLLTGTLAGSGEWPKYSAPATNVGNWSGLAAPGCGLTQSLALAATWTVSQQVQNLTLCLQISF